MATHQTVTKTPRFFISRYTRTHSSHQFTSTPTPNPNSLTHLPQNPNLPNSQSSISDSFLIDRITQTLQNPNLKTLSQFQYKLNPSISVQVLYKCRKDLKLAQKFIDLLAKVSFLKHDSMSLSAMAHVLVRSRRVSEAQVLILRMVRSGISRAEIVDSLFSTYDGCGSNEFVFDVLIRTSVQARKLREGAEAFRVLRKKGVVVPVNACNSLLGGLVKVDWVDMAWAVYWEVAGSGVEVNAFTVNIMVNAMCKEGRVKKVRLFLDEMEEKGVFADVVTYNTLVNAYCREGLLEEAFELKSTMAIVPRWKLRPTWTRR